MANLYNLTNDMQELYKKLDDSIDEETGEIDDEIANALAVKQEEFESKAINVATVIRIFKAKSAEVAAEIERLQAIGEKYDKLIDRLSFNLAKSCIELGFEKIEGMHAAISFRKSEKVIIDDLEALPYEFKTLKTTVSADKKKLKEAIKNGELINGAHIEESKNLQIK